MRREAERMTSFTLIRVRNRGMMGSDFSLLFFFKAGVKQGHFFFSPCCSRAFSSCSEQGLLALATHRLLTAEASPSSGFSSCAAQALGAWASAIAARGLSSCVSRDLEHRLSSCGARAQLPTAHGIFPDQGWNLCPLHWRADSYPLFHQGSP